MFAARNSFLTKVGFLGALDAHTTNLAGAWSVSRRLLTSYTGALIRVRRSSDNAEQDIGYVSGGGLDTAALATFIGANSALVAKIYDQKASNNLEQATASSQGRIVNTGTLDTVNSLPAALFSTKWMQSVGNSGISGSAERGLIAVASITTRSYLVAVGVNSSNSSFGLDINNSSTCNFYHWGNDISTTQRPGHHVFAFSHLSGTSQGWVDGASIGTLALTPTTTNTKVFIGCRSGTTAGSVLMDSYVQEVIQLNSTTNMAAMRTEARTFYGTP